MAIAEKIKEATADKVADSKGDGKEEGKKEGESGGNLTSPEGILMLTAASILDSIGFVLFVAGTWFGIDDYGILDILGMVIIGGWMYMRGGSKNKAVKKGLKRFITATAVEIVPFLGGAAPSWTILVYRTLKNG